MKKRLCITTLGALLLFAAGCEDGGGGSKLGEDHDFGSNDPNLVVAVGDSITLGNPPSGMIPYTSLLSGLIAKRIINAGIGGDVTANGISRARSLLASRKPGYLIVLIGVNDIIRDQNDYTLENIRRMVDAAIANKTIPILATLTPVYAGHSLFSGGVIRLNDDIRALALEKTVTLADLEAAFGPDKTLIWKDGLHPNQRGHDLIANTIAMLFY